MGRCPHRTGIMMDKGVIESRVVTSVKAAGELTRDELHALTVAHMAAHPGTDYITAYKAVGGK